MIKRYKKPTVQLTSLLDLLFCMIFVSLLQSKTPPVKETKVEETPVSPTTKPLDIKSVTGIFHFYKTPNNTSVPTGTYAMSGVFDEKTRELRLGGVSWINRPEGYDMVPLKGSISENNQEFRGRIEFQDCQNFTLKRTTQISGSSLAGKWEGIYDCLQGETGLTLTLQ